MKTCGLVLMVIGLLLVHKGQAKKQVTNHVTQNCNCGNNSKLLIALMRSVLSVCVKKGGNLPHVCPKAAKNCAEVLKCGGKQSGVYSVDPDGKGAFKVYCDQKTAGGGWTVLQKRKDGSVNFNRGWKNYKNGFGDLKGEFWLGLDNIYRLTHQARNRLRVDLQDTKGKSAYAEYNYFAVSSERSKYRLSLGDYSGTAADSLSHHRNMAFTTRDRDNDKYSGNCAVLYKGGWWFKKCYDAYLNGLYLPGQINPSGIVWYKWKGKNYSVMRADMKIRPE